MVDKLVLLLSTDWFMPYWRVLDIEIDGDEQGFIQRGCREITNQILAGASNYYHIAFTPQRTKKTRKLFDSLIKGRSIARSSLSNLIEYWDNLSDEDEKASWMWDVLTSDILAGRIQPRETTLDERILDMLFAEHRAYDLEPYEFSEISESSGSTWDRYTRTLTPEQPTTLADALALVLTTRRFEKYWHSVRKELTAQQAAELVSWYRTVGEARAGRDMVPSYVQL